MNTSICCYLCTVYTNDATWVYTNYQYKFNHTMNNMKKIFLGLAAALMLTACNENRQPEAKPRRQDMIKFMD